MKTLDHRGEIKRSDAFKEGTVLSSRAAPGLYDRAVLTFSGVIASGGAKVAGEKTP